MIPSFLGTFGRAPLDRQFHSVIRFWTGQKITRKHDIFPDTFDTLVAISNVSTRAETDSNHHSNQDNQIIFNLGRLAFEF